MNPAEEDSFRPRLIPVKDPEAFRVLYPGPMCKEVTHFGIFEPTQDFGITEQL